jgi:hypothetical protein
MSAEQALHSLPVRAWRIITWRLGTGHSGAILEPVHLHQDLIQGLLALIIGVADGCATLPPTASISSTKTMHGAPLLATSNMLNELGARNGEKRDPALTSDCPRQQRLSGPRRANKGHSRGYEHQPRRTWPAHVEIPTISRSSSRASSTPATSAKVTVDERRDRHTCTTPAEFAQVAGPAAAQLAPEEQHH